MTMGLSHLGITIEREGIPHSITSSRGWRWMDRV